MGKRGPRAGGHWADGKYIQPTDTEEAVKDEDDVLIMSLRLASGKFESSIQVPLHASDEEKKAFIDSWLTVMEAGLRCGSGRRKESKTSAKEDSHGRS